MPFMLSDFVSGAKGMQEYRDLQEANQAKKDLAKIATEAATPTTTTDTRGLVQNILPGEEAGIPKEVLGKMMSPIPGTETPKEGLTGLGGMQQGISGVEPTLAPAGAKESPLKMSVGAVQKSGQELNAVQKQVTLNEKIADYYNKKGNPALANQYITENQTLKTKELDLQKKHLDNTSTAADMLGGAAGTYAASADDPAREPLARAELLRQAQELGTVPPQRLMQMATMPAPQLKALMEQTRDSSFTASEQAKAQQKSLENEIKRMQQERMLMEEQRKILKDDQDAAYKRDVLTPYYKAKTDEALGKLPGAANTTTYETLAEKVDDPKYGVATGKIPAREQTVARRITTDAKEVTQGIDQVLTLTKGGMKNVTGSTFADAKVGGFLTAPVKAFTNGISNQESAMYDAMMYPLVKGVSLYTNPDYRPTVNDVQNSMIAYKAQAGQPHIVQLEKFAELKKNFLSAAESYLDSNILNPQQANSLKQQIKYVEKAIPWDVNDVTNYMRTDKKQKFEDYLKKTHPDTKQPSTKKVGGAAPSPSAGVVFTDDMLDQLDNL